MSEKNVLDQNSLITETSTLCGTSQKLASILKDIECDPNKKRNLKNILKSSDFSTILENMILDGRVVTR